LLIQLLIKSSLVLLKKLKLKLQNIYRIAILKFTGAF
ncbi:MAG: hypothetical protein ACI9YE_003587, partial [Psychroserpens sp.]